MKIVSLTETAIRVRASTAENNHTEALIIIARYLEGKALQMAETLDNVERLHAQAGELTPALAQVRELVRNRLIEALDPVERNLLKQCL